MQRQHYSVTVSVLPFFLDHLPEMLMMIFFFSFYITPTYPTQLVNTLKPLSPKAASFR